MKPTIKKSAKLTLGKGKKYKITGRMPYSITILRDEIGIKCIQINRGLLSQIYKLK